MEVHAHTHTPRKKWIHYFWEFLMLFLAVFCGFLAEYKLEHTIEHNREKEFMRSMIDDLKKDTATLAESLTGITQSIEKIDSAIKFYTIHKNPTASQVTAIGQYAERGMSTHIVVFTDRTTTQLKNSGGMRLIRNKPIADSLVEYWNGIERIENDYNRSESYRIDARKLGFKMFNHLASLYVKRYIDPALQIESSSLLNDSPQLFGEYINYLAMVAATYRNFYSVRINDQISRADRLIELIRKEYHIK